MGREITEKVREMKKYHLMITCAEHNIKNLLDIRANLAVDIVMTNSDAVRKEKIEAIDGINDRIKELLILEV